MIEELSVLQQQNNIPNNLFEVEIVEKFYSELLKDLSFSKAFSLTLVEDFIRNYLLHIQNDFSTHDVSEFLSNLKEHLNLNLQDFWIIGELNGSYVETDMITSNIKIISGPNIKQKLKEFFSDSEIEHLSKKFKNRLFEYPLIAIKIRAQSEFINDFGSTCLMYANALLYIFAAKEKLPSKDFKIESMFNKTYYKEASKCRISSILCKGERDLFTVRANFDTRCEFNLNFLQSSEKLQQFEELYYYIVNQFFQKNAVRSKVITALKLYRQAVLLEEENNNLTGISTSIVLLNAASECLLLKKENNKKKSLINLYTELLKNHNIQENINQTVGKFYNKRSAFVHEGKMTFKDYKENFSDGENTTLLNSYKYILSLLIFEIVNLSKTYSSLRSWYNYLNQINENSLDSGNNSHSEPSNLM
ncbi:hypothetical protein [Lysinibacillus sp. FSL W8-0992]|uniref:hypothetical protein n=1 Tax=Lysinibacillus sp. FSL W8-0992 TaxID=2954643 RepID=UPI0030F5298F